MKITKKESKDFSFSQCAPAFAIWKCCLLFNWSFRWYETGISIQNFNTKQNKNDPYFQWLIVPFNKNVTIQSNSATTTTMFVVCTFGSKKLVLISISKQKQSSIWIRIQFFFSFQCALNYSNLFPNLSDKILNNFGEKTGKRMFSK